ncbi:mucin-5AC-like [Rhopalosiphum padi]|uniref:mucin-5AC-like n=1 Tax=Rhopalosiphum padi TaxID=40932 RepID=UPI00298DBA4D|nr:mucin-5AC-like [Rhopalosiphum padi]
MGTFRQRMVAIATVLAIFTAAPSVSRSVNISSSWLLPQNEFPVFYRHFRDRVTWFEADAVCQFHHAQLATVESNSQFEAIRTYLKELDVIENVWIGLKRNSEASEFTWTNYQPLARSGYFREEVPRSSDPVCVVTDPTANFKWHSLHCGGPEVASFVCELPVPYWASKSNGCMTSMMEGMTVTFLPERPAIQLTKECSPGVSKNVTCKGNMKQSEIIEKLSCPNSNKPMKTLFKPVKPELADIKLKTTTSSSESDVEDYAIEMATIAQYNDETFQSISKVMGRSSGSMINLPQEMSIAQEPIKSSGRGGFDTNGIDSAFISGQTETTSTDASSIGISTSTRTNTASSVPSTNTVTGSSTTSTSSTTPKSEPKTTSSTTAKQMTKTTPIETATETTTLADLVKLGTTSGTTTHSTTVNKATTSPGKTTTTGRIVTTVGGTLTGGSQPTETSATTPATTTTSNNHHQPRANATNANANQRVYATTAVPKSRSAAQMTTTEKIHTVAKMLTAETGDVRRTTGDSRRPTAATLAAIATVVAKIPYTVAAASATATSTTGRPLNSLRSYANNGNGYVAKTNDAPTIEQPIRVYKKIDFPELPISNDGDYARKPTATPFSGTSATATFSSPVSAATKTGYNNAATTWSSTRPTVTATTTTSASTKHDDALNSGTYAATETATTNTVPGTSPAAVAVDESDDSTHNWNLISSSPPSPPAKMANDAASATPFDITSSATDVTAANAAAEAVTVTAAVTTTASTSAASTTTAAATAAANHRKIANYDAYTDHPNRSRHIVRPKQQHHHSYPYILYRLLG